MRGTTSPPDGATRHRYRRAAVAGLAVGGAALVGTGVFASWQATSSASSGTLAAASTAVQMIDANGGSFATSVPDLLPADYFHRYVELENDGSTATAFTGALSATGVLGAALSAAADACSVPWTSPGGVSTCSGTLTPLLAATPLSSPATVSHGVVGVGPANAQHLRYTFTVSAGAPASMQAKTASVTVAVSSSLVGGRDRTTA